jgi:tetratricopeptide (TPR) repeat protein
MGQALHQEERLDEAISWYRQALQHDARSARALCNLGQALLEKEEVDEALRYCEQAVQIEPNFAEAHNNLGNVLRKLERVEDSKDAYRRAAELKPNLAVAHSNLGAVLQQEGIYDEALACYQKALLYEPRSARIQTSLASLYKEVEREEEAVDRYRLAIQMQPDFMDAHLGLGNVLHDMEDLPGARASFQTAVRLEPESAAAHANLGQVLAELGEIDQATACFRESLRLDPEHVGACSSLATTLRDKTPQEDMAAIDRLMAKTDLSDGDRAALHFALAHVLDAKKDYTPAAEHIVTANKLRAQELNKENHGYNPAEHSRFVDEIIAAFTPEEFERCRGWGSDSELPVFIFGLPRSGTTLTEQILASHPQMFGAGELQLARDAYESLPQVLGIAATPAKCIARMEQSALLKVAAKHLEKLRKLSPVAQRIVDKMPDNYLQVGLLAMMFPRARFIHAQRDVRDVALSCWITNFRSIRWACDLDHIACRIRDYQRLMDHWRKVLPLKMLEIEYEDTVADLEKVARGLVDHCGMEWNDACLAFHKTKRPVRTASITQVRQPIYKGSVARWKNYEEALAPLIRGLENGAPSA